MKLDILQENLNKALSIVSRIVSPKPQLAILSHVLLEATNGHLNLITSNLETTIIAQVGAKITTEGEFTLPARTLAETVSSLSPEKITLELVDGAISLKTSNFSSKINGLAASEYPKPTPKDLAQTTPTWELDKETFVAAVSKVVFAAATDESRAVLTGVLFKPTESGLTLAATDGFRLSVVKLPKTSPKNAPPLIIPSSSLAEVCRLLLEEGKDKDKESSRLKIYLLEDSNQLFFDLGEIKIYSRLIAGNFPDFEKIIPSSSIVKITLEANEFSSAVRLASIFARESANIIKLKTENSKLKISANAPQVGENESEVEAKTEGTTKEELTIAFNYRYLLEFLGCVTGTIVFGASGPLSPGVFQAEADPSFLHIIMPVRVQG